MCILIVCPSGMASLPAAHRAASIAGNPHGNGTAVAGRGGVRVTRTMAGDSAAGIGKADRRRPALFHARIGTHGSMGVHNVHPFDLGTDPKGRQAVVAHNGVLDYDSDAVRSDTHAFAADVLAPLHRAGKLFSSPAVHAMLENYVGEWNKLAFLRSDGEYMIVHEGQGDWVGDVWYSNDSYLGASRYAGSRKIDDDADREDYTAAWSLYSDRDDDLLDWRGRDAK